MPTKKQFCIIALLFLAIVVLSSFIGLHSPTTSNTSGIEITRDGLDAMGVVHADVGSRFNSRSDAVLIVKVINGRRVAASGDLWTETESVISTVLAEFGVLTDDGHIRTTKGICTGDQQRQGQVSYSGY